MIGLALQALALIGKRVVPLWAIACIVSGCLLFLIFWDLDNWMLIATLLMMVGFIPIRSLLLREKDVVPVSSE